MRRSLDPHPPRPHASMAPMTPNEWRITQTTIDVEMLRLAALLSDQSRITSARAGLTPHDANAAHLALHTVLKNAVSSLAKNA